MDRSERLQVSRSGGREWTGQGGCRLAGQGAGSGQIREVAGMDRSVGQGVDRSGRLQVWTGRYVRGAGSGQVREVAGVDRLGGQGVRQWTGYGGWRCGQVREVGGVDRSGCWRFGQVRVLEVWTGQ